MANLADSGRWRHHGFNTAATAVRRHYRLPVLFAIVAVVAAIFYLRSTAYTYSAELRIMPSQAQVGGNASRGGDFGGLAALAGVELGQSKTAPLITLYTEGLHSLAVARELSRDERLLHILFADQWDERRQAWRRPSGFRYRLSTAIYGFLGMPPRAWAPPGEREVRDVLQRDVFIEKSTKTPIVRISFDHPDKAFALSFLQRLDTTVDAMLRESAVKRSSAAIGYLSSQLASTTVAEHREVLSHLLADQEQTRMLTQSPLPYAVERFDPSSVSKFTTWPQPIVVVFGAAVLGILAGTLLVVIITATRDPN